MKIGESGAVLPEVGVVAAMLANVSNHPDIGRDNSAVALAFAAAVAAESAVR